MRRPLIRLTLAMALLALGACGKKAEPVAPSGTEVSYPRKYPSQ